MALVHHLISLESSGVDNHSHAQQLVTKQGIKVEQELDSQTLGSRVPTL